jgi:hypothetical protein
MKHRDKPPLLLGDHRSTVIVKLGSISERMVTMICLFVGEAPSCTADATS